MPASIEHQVKLDDFELELLRRRVGAELLTYTGHNLLDGLFPREKQRLKLLRKLFDKLERAAG